MLVLHRPFVCASSVLHQKRNIEHNNEYPIRKKNYAYLRGFLRELMLKSGDGTSCDVANIEIHESAVPPPLSPDIIEHVFTCINVTKYTCKIVAELKGLVLFAQLHRILLPVATCQVTRATTCLDSAL